MPEVSIVILSWNTRALLADCLRAVADCTQGLDFETLVVDNASGDGSPDMVRADFPWVRLVESGQNLGFAKGNNLGARCAGADKLLLLNSDALLTPGALNAMLAVLDENPRAGLVGARLLNADGSFQASHTPFPTLWREFLILSGLGRLLHGRWYPSYGPQIERGAQASDYVEGAAMLLRREAFQAAGGLDESYGMYCEEVELAYNLREKGWQVWYQPQAAVFHLVAGSSRHRLPQREADMYASRVRFFRKHYGGSAARALKLVLFAFTLAKNIIHPLARLLSGGRRGRQVVSLPMLAAALGRV